MFLTAEEGTLTSQREDKALRSEASLLAELHSQSQRRLEGVRAQLQAVAPNLPSLVTAYRCVGVGVGLIEYSVFSVNIHR